ncbi:MAG: ATP-binding protein [Myxococcaceae bacterium]
MSLPERYLSSWVKRDLAEKAVFVGGPRQVGKTTFALSFLSPPNKSHPAYLNWDIAAHQRPIAKAEFPPDQSLLVLDEIHKYARWRGIVKGFYDAYFPKRHLLVTGSARLDHYRKGGDSLVGRYHYWRLHPFSLPELGKRSAKSDLEGLLTYGGFPEPLARQDAVFHRRWQRERHTRIVKDDLRDLEIVKEISLLESLLDALPERVASPLSIRSLSEDLQVAHATVARWLTLLENVYLVFRISPFGASRIRAIKKEQKLYMWDWSAVQLQNPRLENMVASLLLKYCHFLEDSQGYRMELRYLRDRSGREVDFVVLKEKNPLFAVECKTGDTSLSPHVAYFLERTPIPKFFQVHLDSTDVEKAGGRVRILPLARFCAEMELV